MPSKKDPMGALAEAVCTVMETVSHVQKTGRNQFHRYTYASDADLLRAIQPAMAAAGLALMPVAVSRETVEAAPTRKGARQFRTDVVVTYRLIHTGGGSIELQMGGSGIDGEDKGVYKALTGCAKYLLRQTFLVPTGDDPEVPRQRRQEPREEHTRRVKPAKDKDPTYSARRDKATSSEASEGKAHHPSFKADQGRFFVALEEANLKGMYSEVADYCESLGRPRPSGMDSEGRRKLIAWLSSKEGGAEFSAWLDHSSERGN